MTITTGEKDVYREQRREIEARGLSAEQIPVDPLQLVASWVDEARQADIQIPNAMVLATVDEDGKPSARTVVAEECTARGITFFTSTESPKARHLELNNRAEGVLVWPQLSRQARVSGEVSRLTDKECDEYFQRQSLEFKLQISVSPQSKSIPDRGWLERRARDLSNSGASACIERPPHWVGYLLTPERVEFWQARPDMLHDRIAATRTACGGCDVERLAP